MSTTSICPRTSCDPWGQNRRVIVKLDLDWVNQHWRLTLDQQKCFQFHLTSLTKCKLGKSYTPDFPYHHILKTSHCLKKQTTCTIWKPIWTSTSLPFAYLFTVILLFLAFFICRAVPAGQPINIDLYWNNTIISFAISNPSQITYTVPEEQHEVINDNWGNQEAWKNEDSWIPADDQDILDTQPQLHTS